MVRLHPPSPTFGPDEMHKHRRYRLCRRFGCRELDKGVGPYCRQRCREVEDCRKWTCDDCQEVMPKDCPYVLEMTINSRRR